MIVSTIKTVKDAVAELHCNSACYEFLKNKKLIHHSCWIRWISATQQSRVYIKMSVFNKMLNRDLVKEYFREETDDFIHIYYTLKDGL